MNETAANEMMTYGIDTPYMFTIILIGGFMHSPSWKVTNEAMQPSLLTASRLPSLSVTYSNTTNIVNKSHTACKVENNLECDWIEIE